MLGQSISAFNTPAGVFVAHYWFKRKLECQRVQRLRKTLWRTSRCGS